MTDAGLRHSQVVAGTPFKVDRVSATFRGIYAGLTEEQKLTLGGFAERIDSTLVCSRAQFEGYWVPTTKDRIFVHNKVFQVSDIKNDEASFTLGLKGLSQ